MYPMPAIAIEVSHFIIIIVIIVAFHAPSTHLSYSLLQNAKDDANDEPLKESMHGQAIHTGHTVRHNRLRVGFIFLLGEDRI